MDLVIDANILFAALIKSGITHELMLEGNIHLYAPEYLLEEFNGKREIILNKTDRSYMEFDEILDIFRRRIEFIPFEEIEPYIEQAKEISPDIKDIPYIALALKMHISIWSNDKELREKQDEIEVLTTRDVMDILS